MFLFKKLLLIQPGQAKLCIAKLINFSYARATLMPIWMFHIVIIDVNLNLQSQSVTFESQLEIS